MISYPLLLSALCFTVVRSEPRSPTKNELMTQESIIVRAGMATVIKDYRYDFPTLIDITDRRELLDLVSGLQGTSEELLWNLHLFERSDLASSGSIIRSGLIYANFLDGEPGSRDTAHPLAAQNIHKVMNRLGHTAGEIEKWVLNKI